MFPVNRKVGNPIISNVTSGNDLLNIIVDSLEHFFEKGYRKIAIIGQDLKQTFGIYKQLEEQGLTSLQLVDNDDVELKGKILLIPSYLVKGMEFDAVIIPNVNDKRYGLDSLDAKLLYISVTRAHHALHMYYHGELSPLFKGLTHDEMVIEN